MNYHLGVRRRHAKPIVKRRRKKGPRRGRRVFKATRTFRKKPLSPLSALPMIWSVLYPEAFAPKDPIPAPPPELIPDEFRAYDFNYDPRDFVPPVESIIQFVREVVSDPGWQELVEACADSGEDAVVTVTTLVHFDMERDTIADTFSFFGLPVNELELSQDPDEEWIGPYAEILAHSLNAMMPDDIPGWLAFGFEPNFHDFDLFYIDCGYSEEHGEEE